VVVRGGSRRTHERDGELEGRARPVVARRPQPSAVSFNDRPANRQTHPHTIGLGGEEGIEYTIKLLGGNADA
jgi:hypothetical protein